MASKEAPKVQSKKPMSKGQATAVANFLKKGKGPAQPTPKDNPVATADDTDNDED